jgi:hypothetical protein
MLFLPRSQKLLKRTLTTDWTNETEWHSAFRRRAERRVVRGHCRLGPQRPSPSGWSPCTSAPHLTSPPSLLARWTGRPAPQLGGLEIKSTESSRETARPWLLTTVHNLKVIEQIKHSSNKSHLHKPRSRKQLLPHRSFRSSQFNHAPHAPPNFISPFHKS